MKLLQLNARGFRSFEQPVEVDFRKLSGFVRLTGRNELEPELGANGAGKSSIMDALCWGLYGVTSNGLKAGDVKTWWGDNQCVAEVSWESLSHSYNLYRSWRPNKLQLSSDGSPYKECDQQEVDRAIGMPGDLFLVSVYFGQFCPSFLDLRPNRQLELYSHALSLDVWERASDTAAETSRLLDAAMQQLELNAARTRGAIPELERQVEELEEQSLAWARGRLDELKGLWFNLLDVQATIAMNEDQTRKNGPKGIDYEHLKALEADERMHDKAADAATDRFDRAVKGVVKARAFGTDVDQETNCPACAQPISQKHIRKHRDELVQLAQREHDDAQKALHVAHAKHEEASKVLIEERVVVRKKEEAVAILVKNTEGLKVEERRLNERITTLRNQEDIAAAKLVGAHHRLEDARKVSGSATDELNEQRKLTESLRYWVKGFRDVRLWLIDESLEQLELEVNNALSALGLNDWTIEFDVERETKSGNVSRGFMAFVSSPYTNGKVPLEAYSGGERQRLRIACSIGIADLFRASCGIETNVELWDEPSSWINQEGIGPLLEALKARATDKQVWVADHRAFDYGHFDHIITAVKDDNGSRLEIT